MSLRNIPPPESPELNVAEAGTPAPGVAAGSLEAIWPQVVATAARQSPLLGQALSHATAHLDEGGTVTMQFGPDSALFHDGVARQQAVVETILEAALGAAVRLVLGGGGELPSGADRKMKRLSAEEHRNERLAQLRSRDPALDAAATALDLELLDDA